MLLFFFFLILNYTLIRGSSLKYLGPKLLIFLRCKNFKELTDLKNYSGTLQIPRAHTKLLNPSYLQKCQGTIFSTDIFMIS